MPSCGSITCSAMAASRRGNVGPRPDGSRPAFRCSFRLGLARSRIMGFARGCSLQDTRADVLDGPHIPPGLMPFAQDWGGNYFCVDGETGGVYFFAVDCGDDFERGKRYLLGSLKTFIDNLVEEA